MSTAALPPASSPTVDAARRLAWLILGDRRRADQLVGDVVHRQGEPGLLDAVRRAALVERSHRTARPHEWLWETTRRLPRRERARIAQRLFGPAP